ncbi:MAG: ABC transporter substrate-binding protein [bacterium]|nr:ABC transporter substrate-binding protein [bacterium]
MNMLRRIAVACLLIAVGFAAGCSQDVKIGAVISESGAVSAYGDKVRKGLDLALDEVNTEGGLGGSVSLIYKDDATNPDRGAQVVEELIKQDGVRIIIGAISSSVTLRIAPLCEKSRVILLSPSASTPKITDAGDYIYRNWPSDIVEGTAMAKFARDLGLEKVAVFAMNNDFGAGLSDVFKQQYEGRFRQIVKVYDFDDNASGEFAAMVEEVKGLEPDGIYIVAYVEQGAELLKQLEAAGVEALRMGSAVTEEMIALAGGAAENLIFPQPNFDVESEDPVVARFVDAYRKKYSEDPDIYAAHGYDALKLVYEAAKLNGSAHPNDIKLGLRGLKEYEGAAGRTMFDANGDVVRYPRIFIVKDGQPIPYEKFVNEGGSLFAGS